MSASTIEVTQERIDAYAEVSGDRNPLHVDPAFAAGTPFGRTIAHGHLLLGVIAHELQQRHPAWTIEGSISVKFIAPVYAGDSVRVELDGDDVSLLVGDRACVVGTAVLRGASDG